MRKYRIEIKAGGLTKDFGIMDIPRSIRLRRLAKRMIKGRSQIVFWSLDDNGLATCELRQNLKD